MWEVTGPCYGWAGCCNHGKSAELRNIGAGMRKKESSTCELLPLWGSLQRCFSTSTSATCCAAAVCRTQPPKTLSKKQHVFMPRSMRNKLDVGEQKATLLVRRFAEEIHCPCLVWEWTHRLSFHLWSAHGWSAPRPGRTSSAHASGWSTENVPSLASGTQPFSAAKLRLHQNTCRSKKIILPWRGWGEFGCAICVKQEQPRQSVVCKAATQQKGAKQIRK